MKKQQTITRLIFYFTFVALAVCASVKVLEGMSIIGFAKGSFILVAVCLAVIVLLHQIYKAKYIAKKLIQR